jgi:enterochelin esterase family protein
LVIWDFFLRIGLVLTLGVAPVAALTSSGPPADAEDLAGTGFYRFVDRLETLPFPARQAAVDSFLARLPGGTAPLVGDSLAHFIFRGPGKRIALAGDLNGWEPVNSFTHVPGTDFWHLTLELPPDARLDYKLVTDQGQWLLDPLNPRQCTGGFGPNSELAMPAYVDPVEILDHGHPPCRIVTLERVLSPQLGNQRTVKLVLPPRFDPAAAHPLLIIHDGLEYITLARLDRVLAHLAAGRPDWVLPICVCVPPVNRTEEYVGNQREGFGNFLVDTVLPLVAGRLGLPVPERLGSLGASNGGAISLFLASRYPGRFDRLGLMSPSVPDELLDRVLAPSDSAPRIYLNWGSYDLLPLLPMIRNLADRLAASEVPYLARRYPEGHSWGLWRATLDEALVFLYPPAKDP